MRTPGKLALQMSFRWDFFGQIVIGDLVSDLREDGFGGYSLNRESCPKFTMDVRIRSTMALKRQSFTPAMKETPNKRVSEPLTFQHANYVESWRTGCIHASTLPATRSKRIGTISGRCCLTGLVGVGGLSRLVSLIGCCVRRVFSGVDNCDRDAS